MLEGVRWTACKEGKTLFLNPTSPLPPFGQDLGSHLHSKEVVHGRARRGHGGSAFAGRAGWMFLQQGISGQLGWLGKQCPLLELSRVCQS